MKTRMLECTEYLFKRHGMLSREVASIRAGTGYRDTASDLLRFVEIYEDKKSTLEEPLLDYRDTDAAGAIVFLSRAGGDIRVADTMS